MSSAPALPLLVATDPDLVDDLLRLATASGTEVQLAPDLVGARPRWAAAPMVLVELAVAEAHPDVRLPRRPGVVLVSRREPWEAPAAQPPDEGAWRVAAGLGAQHIVFLPDAEPWLVDRFADAASGPAGPGRVVGVVGGRGGAGASVLASALAVTAARYGLRPLLVDADPLGGGLDLVVGREETAGLRWPDLAATAGRVSAPMLFDALPRVGELCVLSWDRGDVLAVPPAAVDAAIDAGRRGSDLVVVDLPRRPDEAAVHALHAADVVLLVVPAELRACAAAARVASLIGPHCSRLECVVRGPAPSGLQSRDLAAALGLPLAGIIRGERGLRAALERGEVPAGRSRGPLAVFCRQFLATMIDRPLAA